MEGDITQMNDFAFILWNNLYYLHWKRLYILSTKDVCCMNNDRCETRLRKRVHSSIEILRKKGLDLVSYEKRKILFKLFAKFQHN